MARTAHGGSFVASLGRRLRRLSLRARLLLGLVLIAALGLVVTDVIVYNQIKTYLLGQVDDQLVSPSQQLLRQLGSGISNFPSSGLEFRDTVPTGTGGAILGSGGQVLSVIAPFGKKAPTLTWSAALAQRITSGLGVTQLSDQLTAGVSPPVTHLTVQQSGSSSEYRVLALPFPATVFNNGAPTEQVVVVAVFLPLAPLDATLRHLVEVDLAASAAVLAILAVLAIVVVRLGMRPLLAIEETAEAIAAGDLQQRVDDDDPRTEVGRLGGALNTMLAQIEHAFTEQQASELQLRQFLADASHELRTPVTSIRGYSELFRRGAVASPEELALAMRRIEDEAARMGVLVDDLLLLARLDQGRPLETEAVDFSELAIDAAADAQARSPARAITVDANESVVVHGDEQRLRQVVANLVQNALVHTPDGTPITVQVRAVGDSAVLAVRDEGPGIAPEHLEHIFERFYRADPSRTRASGGTGLGLAIVASIAEAHGGRARVESDPGRSTTFVVELPLDRTPIEPMTPASHSPSVASRSFLDAMDDTRQESGVAADTAEHGAPLEEASLPAEHGS